MTIFITGIGLFVGGAVLAIIARMIEGRQKASVEEPFFKWFLEVLTESFSLVVGPGHSMWVRLAALGTIISALGVLTAVVGLVAWSTA